MPLHKITLGFLFENYWFNCYIIAKINCKIGWLMHDMELWEISVDKITEVHACVILLLSMNYNTDRVWTLVNYICGVRVYILLYINKLLFYL